MSLGGQGIISSILVSSKGLLILATFLVMGIALVAPTYNTATDGSFPYIGGFWSHNPWTFFIPLDPMLDFIGFWMVGGGGLMTIIVGFFVPKK